MYEYQDTHDVTTGLYNESRIKKYISSEIKRSDRYKHNLSFVVFDFKDHNMEKEDYINFAELLKSNTRDQDFAARLHKNRFALLLPESDISAATVVKDKIINEYYENEKFGHFDILFALSEYSKGETNEQLIEKVLKELH